MTALINDAELEQQLIRERQRTGADRFDEVWEGVYVMSPLANNEHQQIAFQIGYVLQIVVGKGSGAKVFVGVNVSDRQDNWKSNYRCPDVAVVLPGNVAKDCDTHLCGGPDFIVEILSPSDRAREKLAFYASIGVRELLIIDRDPWQLELYRLRDSALELSAASSLKQPQTLSSDVLPVSFLLRASDRGRPDLEIVRVGENASDSWLI